MELSTTGIDIPNGDIKIGGDSVATESWVTNGNISHSHLTDISASDHHARYTDSEARTAVDGASINISGDADTVDGKDADQLGGVTEHNNLSGISADDHHAKPTATQSTTPRPTYTQLYSTGAGDGYVSASSTGPFDGVYVQCEASSGDAGSAVEVTDPNDNVITRIVGTGLYLFEQSREIESFDIDTSGCSTTGYGVTFSHSHSI